MPTRIPFPLYFSLLVLVLAANAAGQSEAVPSHPIVLHAARLLDVKTGRILKPAEILVQNERIIELGASGKVASGKGRLPARTRPPTPPT